MKAFGAILLQIILLELILGGGGRFTAFGPISLRMILFGVAILYTIIQIWKGYKLDLQYSAMILLFIAVIALSALIGFLGDANHSLIFEDIKPLSFFFILPFFVLTINDEKILKRISTMIIYGAFLLSVMYLLTLMLVNTGVIPFRDFYQLTAPSEELFYRGELAFFYKGFIFLCIGLIFIYFQRPEHSIVLATTIILAILLTFTRGFVFALLLTGFIFYLITKKASLNIRISKLIIILIFALLIVFKGNKIYGEISKSIHKSEVKPAFTREFQPDKLLGDRDFSNKERKKQLNQVLERTTMTSSLVGHGFGIGVPVRPIHMEISYLEIFHKQGMIGLLFWGLIFFLLTKKCFYVARKDNSLAYAFYFGSLFIFFQSMTNQYFNNPIGMSFILIALVSLDVIPRNND